MISIINQGQHVFGGTTFVLALQRGQPLQYSDIEVRERSWESWGKSYFVIDKKIYKIYAKEKVKLKT